MTDSRPVPDQSGNVCQRNGEHISDCEEADLCGNCGGDDVVLSDRFGPIYDGRDGCIEADDDDPWCNGSLTPDDERAS